MKRGSTRAWPRRIIEVASTRPDPRAADPAATQKISREELDAVLKRTKSGTRAAQRRESLPDGDASYTGPRDDGPEVTIVGIDSIEFEAIDPASLPAPAPSDTRLATPPSASSPRAPALLTPLTATLTATPRRSSIPSRTRLQVTPQLALLVGLALFAFVVAAAVVGFFAGRITLP